MIFPLLIIWGVLGFGWSVWQAQSFDHKTTMKRYVFSTIMGGPLLWLMFAYDLFNKWLDRS